jgi:hypothetical protein
MTGTLELLRGSKKEGNGSRRDAYRIGNRVFLMYGFKRTGAGRRHGN